jgi:hypothetical protein
MAEPTREHFKLEKEIDDILEQETHEVRECGYDLASLKDSENLERSKPTVLRLVMILTT